MTQVTEIQTLSIMPNEVLRQIFNGANDADLLQMRRVCRQWDYFIRSDNRLFNRIIWRTSLWGSCVLSAKNITSQDISIRDKSELLRDIVKIVAPIDIAAARETASSIDEDVPRYCALVDIVEAEAECDIPAATASALKITDSLARDEALACIVIKVAEFDIPAAKVLASTHNIPKDLLFLHIVEKEVKYDFRAAIATTQAIAVDCVQFEAYKLIAKRVSKFDISSAKAIAQAITDSDYRDGLLVKIVKKEAQHNRPAARATALSIDNMFFRVLALIEIAKADPQHDLTDAKAAAEHVVDTNMRPFKLEALIRIAKVDPQHDLTTAKIYFLCTHLIRPSKNYFTHLSHFYLIKAEAKYDLSAARKTALSILDEEERGSALQLIVKTEIKQNNLEAAKATAKTIENPGWRSRAILEIVKEEVKTNLENAKVTAEAIHNNTRPYDRDQIFLELLKAKAQQNIFAERTEVLAMPNSVLKAKALLKIAEIAQSRLPSRIK